MQAFQSLRRFFFYSTVKLPRDVHARDRKMVEKVEDLKDGVETLKEEYGRKIYLDEVADFMSISEEEAVGILRLAGEEVPDDPDPLEETK